MSTWFDFDCSCGFHYDRAVPPNSKEFECNICGKITTLNWKWQKPNQPPEGSLIRVPGTNRWELGKRRQRPHQPRPPCGWHQKVWWDPRPTWKKVLEFPLRKCYLINYNPYIWVPQEELIWGQPEYNEKRENTIAIGLLLGYFASIVVVLWIMSLFFK